MSLMLWVAGAVASALVGLMITILFQDRISAILVRAVPGFWITTNRRSLSGIWYSYYAVSPEHGTSFTAAPADAVLLIRLRQIGSRVAGTSARESRNYAISAALQGDFYLTGTWRNFTGGRYDWGAFQLYWPSGSTGMAGKFVGKDSQNHINHGIWLWGRTEKDLHEMVARAVKLGYASDAVALTERLYAALTVLE